MLSRARCWCSSRPTPKQSKLLTRAGKALEVGKLPLDADARLSLARMADGDGRAT